MSDRPLVSVLMTAYNREQYITQAVESVLASTLRDFELIIVDDGSTDATVDIARHYLSDPRVQVHVNPRNLGDYPNRNRAAELAQGKYLKYVDSDDYIYPHGLAVMVGCMEQFPEAGLGLGSHSLFSQPFPVQLTPLEAYREHFFIAGFMVKAPLSVIIRHAAFQAVGGFSGKPYIGDNELWLKLAARYSVVKMPRDLVWWRLHSDQEYQLGQPTYPVLTFQITRAALTGPDCPLSREERSLALRLLKWNYAHLIISDMAHRRFRRAWQLYQATEVSCLDLWQSLWQLRPVSSFRPS